MKKKKLFAATLFGGSLCLLCCAVPILTIGLGALGLGAFTGYLEYVFISVLAIIAGLILFAAKNKKITNKSSCCTGKNSCCSKNTDSL